MPALTRRRSRLSDQAYEALRRMIVRGDLAPGARLSEPDLTDQLDVGRTPLREALLRLSQDPDNAEAALRVHLREVFARIDARQPDSKTTTGTKTPLNQKNQPAPSHWPQYRPPGMKLVSLIVSHETNIPVLAANQVDLGIAALAEAPERMRGIDFVIYPSTSACMFGLASNQHFAAAKTVDDLNKPDITIAYETSGR